LCYQFSELLHWVTTGFSSIMLHGIELVTRNQKFQDKMLRHTEGTAQHAVHKVAEAKHSENTRRIWIILTEG